MNLLDTSFISGSFLVIFFFGSTSNFFFKIGKLDFKLLIFTTALFINSDARNRRRFINHIDNFIWHITIRNVALRKVYRFFENSVANYNLMVIFVMLFNTFKNT